MTQVSTNRWRLADASISLVTESESPLLSPSEIYMDCDRGHIERNLSWLAPRFYDSSADRLVITIQTFLIRRSGMTLLLDTGCGNDKARARPFFNRRSWPWLERLRAEGVEPEDVSVVICSHLHVDHVGWNTRLEGGRWVPTFPNARYLITQKEWAYWKHECDVNDLSRTGNYVADSVLPLFDAGQLELIPENYRIDSAISLEPAPGHTPGHFTVHLLSGNERVIFTGDLIHHPLQLRYPDWSTRFCADPALACQSRHSFLQAHADTETLIFAAHFPTPTGGFLCREGDHYNFRFCGESRPIMPPGG